MACPTSMRHARVSLSSTDTSTLQITLNRTKLIACHARDQPPLCGMAPGNHPLGRRARATPGAHASRARSRHHVAAGRLAEVAAEHGHEGAGAGIAHGIGDFGDRVAVGQALQRAYQPGLLPPLRETAAGFAAEQPAEAAWG